MNYSMAENKNNDLPTFDYDLLTKDERLATLENEKKLDEIYNKYRPEIGEVLYNQQQVLANHKSGVFEKWFTSKGFKKWRVYDYINRHKYIVGISNDIEKLEIFEEIPSSLQSEMAKPSADERVNQAVYDGKVRTPKKYKEMEKQLNEKDEEVDQVHNGLPEKDEEVKEVIPPDYQALKEENQSLHQAVERLSQDVKQLEEDLSKQDEHSKKYEELNRQLKEMNGQLTEGQKRIQAQKDIYRFTEESNQAIDKLSTLIYLVNEKEMSINEYAREPIEKIIDDLEDICHRLKQKINQTNIIEGEIIHG